MPRRIHLHSLSLGEIPLDPIQAHHARDVLRLATGTEVEVFDDAGMTARGIFLHVGPHAAAVRIERIEPAPPAATMQWTVAAAVPKGDRADWMIEKLSELGASAFIPLAAARSVVLPEGKQKRQRWMRIATESAKQSRRAGVMRIDELTPLDAAVKSARENVQSAWFLATEVPGTPIAQAAESAREAMTLALFIGPEGGWTEAELKLFFAAMMTPVRMGATILRIETAAVAAGAVVVSLLGNRA